MLDYLAYSWRSQPASGGAPAAAIPDWVADSGCAGMVWGKLRHAPLGPTDAGRGLAQAYRSQAAASLRGRSRIVTVWRRLEEAGLHPILIKGWSTARLYGDLALRSLGDIDLCFPPAELARAIELCRDFPDDFALTDLHSGVPDLPDRGWDEIYGRAQCAPLGDCSIRVLGPADHLRLTCRHFIRHGGRPATILCDVAAILESLPDDFDWDAACKGEPHETRWVLAVIGLARELVGAEIRDPRMAERIAQPPRWLVDALEPIWAAGRARRPLGYYLRRPGAALEALRWRYLNPIRAAFRFGMLPRTGAQLAWARLCYLLRRRVVDLVKRPLCRLVPKLRPRPAYAAMHEDLD